MKNVLVALLGLTPQIITETVYAYSVLPTLEDGESVRFDEIHLLTTEAGLKKAEQELMGESGILARLCYDYNLSPPKLDRSTITVLGEDAPLADVRSSAQGMEIADQIARVIHGLTSDKNTTLYCSLAGGRKTMGAWLSLVMQVYGREQDRLSHVLVSEEFEGARHKDTGEAFAYPLPKSGEYVNKRLKKTFNSCDAQIDLAEIPLLSLRRYIKAKNLNFRDALYEALVHAGLENPVEQVVVDLDDRQALCVGQHQAQLKSKQWAFYVYLLHRKLTCDKEKGCEICESRDCYLNISEFLDADEDYTLYLEVLDLLGLLNKRESDVYKYWLARFGDGGETEFNAMEKVLGEYPSNLNRRFLPKASLPGFSLLSVVSEKTEEGTRYGVSLDRKKIVFNWPEGSPGRRHFLGDNWPDKPPD